MSSRIELNPCVRACVCVCPPNAVSYEPADIGLPGNFCINILQLGSIPSLYIQFPTANNINISDAQNLIYGPGILCGIKSSRVCRFRWGVLILLNVAATPNLWNCIYISVYGDT